ncbi:MAG: hypothetical protein ACRDU8_02005 [Egibacteraceae bacterium]
MASAREHGASLLQAMLRYRRWIVAATLLAGLAGWGASRLQETLYEATGALVLADPQSGQLSGDAAPNIDANRFVLREAERIKSGPVLSTVAESLDVQRSADYIERRLTVEPAENVERIVLTYVDPDPQVAAQVVDGVAQAYQDAVAEQVRDDADAAIAELDATRERLQLRILDLEERLGADPESLVVQTQLQAASQQLVDIEARAEELSVNAALHGSGVELYEPADVPGSPVQPKPVQNAVAAGLLAMIATTALAWWAAGRSDKALDRDDPAAVLGVPLLGAVPPFRRGLPQRASRWTLSTLGGPATESFGFIAASLEHILEESGGRVVLVTSTLPGEGKTMTTLNLATVAHRPLGQVSIVDGDVRARGLSKLADTISAVGLTDLALKQMDPAVISTHLRTRLTPTSSERRSTFIPAGSRQQDTAGFFRTNMFRKALIRIKENADLVLLDSPPVLAVSDTLAMASQVDAVVLVVGRGTPLSKLAEVRRRLEFVGAPLVGYVFNWDKALISDEAYGYGEYS